MAKIALLFPGQGSQFVGMGKSLCESHKIAALTFEEANDVLGFDLRRLCFEGEAGLLTETANAQPALLTHSVAAFRVYMQEYGMVPKLLAGHSLGEYSALTAAEAMRFSDALKLVRRRGELMQESVAIGQGAMIAVSEIEPELAEAECRRVSPDAATVGIACYNSLRQLVLSGTAEAIKQAEQGLRSKGAKVTPLKVSAPFHSPLMAPAAAKLNEELQRYEYQAPRWKVLSNVTARPYPTFRTRTHVPMVFRPGVRMTHDMYRDAQQWHIAELKKA